MQLFLRPDSRVWWVRFTVDGTQRRESTHQTDRAKAETEARRLLRAPQGHSAPLPEEDDASVAFLLHRQALAAKRIHPRTIANYACYEMRFFEFFGHRSLASLSPADIEGWRDWLLAQHLDRDNALRFRTLAPRTVAGHLGWLAAVFKRLDARSPVRLVSRPRPFHSEQTGKLRYYTRDEMRLLFAALPDSPPAFRRAFVFLAYTGCRTGEITGNMPRLAGLRNTPDDIQPQTMTVWVTGKGSKRRQLTLAGSASPAWDAVQDQIVAESIKPGGRVWPYGASWISDALEAACRRVGIPFRSPHALRHTFATHALMYWGWDISLLAKWLGHKNIAITYATYGHLTVSAPPKIAY